MKPSKNCIVHIKGSDTNSVLSEEETAPTDSRFSFFPTSAAKYRIRDLHLLMQNACQACLPVDIFVYWGLHFHH